MEFFKGEIQINFFWGGCATKNWTVFFIFVSQIRRLLPCYNDLLGLVKSAEQQDRWRQKFNFVLQSNFLISWWNLYEVQGSGRAPYKSILRVNSSFSILVCHFPSNFTHVVYLYARKAKFFTLRNENMQNWCLKASNAPWLRF